MKYTTRAQKVAEEETQDRQEARASQGPAAPQVIRFNPQSADDEETIDLGLLFGELMSKWYWLLLALAVGAAVMFVVTFFFMTPQYEGVSKIYIYNKSTSISISDLQIGQQLTSDFQIIAKTREVVEEAVTQTGLDIDYEEALKKITINNPDSSRVLEIVITDPDPVTAAIFSNNLANVLRDRIGEVTNTDKPSLVEKAIPNYKKVSPSYTKNILIGALVAFILAAAVIIIITIRDDTIKSEEDVQKFLGLNTLALIPVNRSQVKTAAASAGSKSSKSKAKPKKASK